MFRRLVTTLTCILVGSTAVAQTNQGDVDKVVAALVSSGCEIGRAEIEGGDLERVSGLPRNRAEAALNELFFANAARLEGDRVTLHSQVCSGQIRPGPLRLRLRSQRDAERYVSTLIENSGCSLSFSDFQRQVNADYGFSHVPEALRYSPRFSELSGQSFLIMSAPAFMIERGDLVAEGDPQTVRLLTGRCKG